MTLSKPREPGFKLISELEFVSDIVMLANLFWLVAHF